MSFELKNFIQIFMESSTNQYSLPFCISLKSRSRKYLSAGPRALVITVILRRFSNSSFSRSKLNIKNLSDRSLEVLVFSQKIENIYDWSKIHLHATPFGERVFRYLSPQLPILREITVRHVTLDCVV